MATGKLAILTGTWIFVGGGEACIADEPPKSVDRKVVRAGIAETPLRLYVRASRRGALILESADRRATDQTAVRLSARSEKGIGPDKPCPAMRRFDLYHPDQHKRWQTNTD